MDIGRAFNYPRNDPGWIVKLLIFAVCTMVPIVNFAAFGYMLEAVRRVARGDEATLPEWDNFGGYFVDGLRVFVTMLVYAIPLIAVIVVSIGMALAASGSRGGEAAGGIVMILAQLFQIFWQFLIWVVWPAMIVSLAFNAGWGAGFNFGGMMGTITRNAGNYVMVLVMTIGFGIFGMLGILACGVGLLITLPWAQLSMAHLFGQLAAQNAQGSDYVG